MRRYRVQESGAISFGMVLAITLLLTITTTSIVSLAINELRQTSDYDLSQRARTAAEAGMQDAIQTLREQAAAGTLTGFDQQCGDAGSSFTLDDAGTADASDDTEITCQIIQTSVGALTDYVDADKSVQLQLDSAEGPFDTVRISWWLDQVDVVGGSAKIPAELTPTSPYNRFAVNPHTLPDQVAPYLRFAAASYPLGSAFNSNAVLSQQGIIYPESAIANTPLPPRSSLPPDCNTVTDYGGTAGCSTPTNPDDDLASGVFADCAPAANPYRCYVELSGFNSARGYVLNLRPLYKGTHYKVELLDGANIVQIGGQQALIDVTAKVANVYRRVRGQINLAGPGRLLLPDYALYSDTTLCKDFQVESGGRVTSANSEDGCEAS